MNSACYNSVPSISPFQSNGAEKIQPTTVTKPPEQSYSPIKSSRDLSQRRNRKTRQTTSDLNQSMDQAPKRHTITPTNAIDDLPIPSKSRGNKTFEQLLEEELAREEKAKETPVQESSRKAYLKKKDTSANKSQQNSTAKKFTYYRDKFNQSK